MNSTLADAIEAADATPSRNVLGLFGAVAFLCFLIGGYLFGVQFAFSSAFFHIDAFQTISLVGLVILLSIPPLGIAKLLFRR